jgi:hypothetical protein
MQINYKYSLPNFPLKLRVIRAFDFEIEPILLLEKDLIGNNFLSYLIFSDFEKEQRAYIQVSQERLNEILTNEISLNSAFEKPENEFIYIAEFSHNTGQTLDSFLVPVSLISEAQVIPKNYVVNYEKPKNEVVLKENDLLDFSERKQKIVFDFYLQSQNLINNIKPYALYKVFTPIIEIIKNMLEFDNRNADKYLAFSNLRQASFGITIELNYSHDLFLQKETTVIENLILLLNAQSKEDFETVLYKTKNDNYLKHYITIIKAIIENNADLHTAYANPITKDIKTNTLNKERAEIAKKIIDETLDVIEDVEEIKGTFLEIDIDRKEPSFKIYSFEDEFTVKGKFELSILEKVKNDFVNIGKETYVFQIKTLYFPETTLKSEEIKRYLIDYQKESE